MSSSRTKPTGTHVLSYLAPRLTDQKENLVTNAIGFLLRKSRAAKECFEKMLSEGCGEEISIGRIENQESLGAESRPDIAVYDKNGALRVLVEAKIWAGLTDAQPSQYLKRLEESGGRALLFVVPAIRMESIASEIESRIRSLSMPMKPWKTVAHLRKSELKGGTSILIMTWNSLIGSLQAACDRANDADTASDIRQIEGLIRTFETEGFTPLSHGTLTDLEIPRLMTSFTDICKQVIQKAIKTGIVTNKGLRWTPLDYGAGSYVWIRQAECWVGLDTWAWLKFQSSPFWMIFSDRDFGQAGLVRKALGKWENGHPPRLFFEEENSELFVPIFVKPGAVETDVIEHLVSQIADVTDAVAKSKIPEICNKKGA